MKSMHREYLCDEVRQVRLTGLHHEIEPLLPEKRVVPPQAFYASQSSTTTEDWEKLRPRIVQLYLEEKRSLRDVMGIMRDQHSFRATTKMYKSKLTDWKVRKYLTSAQRDAVCERLAHSKGVFRPRRHEKIIVNGQERNLTMFARHMKQSQHQTQPKHLREMRPLFVHPGQSSSPPHYHAFRGPHLYGDSPTHVQYTLYPAGLERTVEIVCAEISYMCGDLYTVPHVVSAVPHDFSGLDNNLDAGLGTASAYLSSGRYWQARVLFYRAGECLDQYLRRCPLSALCKLLHVRQAFFALPEELHSFWASFERHLLQLCRTIYGARHPTTVILGQLAGKAYSSIAMSSTLLCAAAALQVDVAQQLSRRIRLRLAEVYRQSGRLSDVEPILYRLLVESEEPGAHIDDRITALNHLAYFHLNDAAPSNADEAERLFQQIADISANAQDRDIRLRSAGCSARGLYNVAKARHDTESAIRYQRQCLAARIELWGTDYSGVLSVAEDLANMLEQQDRIQEAAEVRVLCKLTDELEGLAIN